MISLVNMMSADNHINSDIVLNRNHIASITFGFNSTFFVCFVFYLLNKYLLDVSNTIEYKSITYLQAYF